MGFWKRLLGGRSEYIPEPRPVLPPLREVATIHLGDTIVLQSSRPLRLEAMARLRDRWLEHTGIKAVIIEESLSVLAVIRAKPAEIEFRPEALSPEQREAIKEGFTKAFRGPYPDLAFGYQPRGEGSGGTNPPDGESGKK